MSSIRFERGPGHFKYSAWVTRRDKPTLGPIHFGDKRYEQFEDRVLGLYSNKDHLDKRRRAAYRKRHGVTLTKDRRRAVDVKFSPAWFSWHYLW
jgi:hypothetical protein